MFVPCYDVRRPGRTGGAMAKTEFLQIRLTPEDRKRLLRIAAADHLDASTWARQVILRALEKREPTQPKKR